MACALVSRKQIMFQVEIQLYNILVYVIINTLEKGKSELSSNNMHGEEIIRIWNA